MVKRPRGLKILDHPLPQAFRDLVQAEEVLKVPELGLVLGPTCIHSLDDGSDAETRDMGSSDGYERRSLPTHFPKTTACIKAPISIMTTEKIFSAFVLAATFPKPTEVRLDVVKYRAVR